MTPYTLAGAMMAKVSFEVELELEEELITAWTCPPTTFEGLIVVPFKFFNVIFATELI